MPEIIEPKKRPQRATTSIRPPALDRLNLVLQHLPKDRPTVTDAITEAVDRFTRPLIKKHNIQLPPGLEFGTSE